MMSNLRSCAFTGKTFVRQMQDFTQLAPNLSQTKQPGQHQLNPMVKNINPSTTSYTTTWPSTFKNMAVHKDFPTVVTLFSHMRRAGMAPTMAAYTTLMQTFVHQGKMEAATAVLLDMRSHGESDPAFYCDVVTGWFRRNKVEQATQIIELMAQDQIEPPAALFSAVMRWCQGLDLKKKVMALARETGVPLEEPAYFSLVYAALGEGKFEEAFGFVDEMYKDGVKLSVRMLLLILNTFARQDNLDVTMVKRVLDAMTRAKVAPNTEILNALAYTFSKCKEHAMAVKVLETMRDQRMKPHNQTFLTVLRGLGTQNNELRNTVVNLMRQHGLDVVNDFCDS